MPTPVHHPTNTTVLWDTSLVNQIINNNNKEAHMPDITITQYAGLGYVAFMVQHCLNNNIEIDWPQ